MRITIVGCGAMGSIYAGLLASAGHDVTGIDTNSAHVDAINKNGLRVSGASGDRTVHINALTEPGDEPADLLIVAVKGAQIAAAAANIGGLIDRKTLILTIQNGLGSADTLAAVTGGERLIVGVAQGFGASLPAPGHAHHNDMKAIRMGAYSNLDFAEVERVSNAYATAGFDAAAVHDIAAMQWEKLICNVAYSAIAGLTGMTVGEIMDDPVVGPISQAAATEAWETAKAAGINIDVVDPVQHVRDFAARMRDAKPSVLLDVEAGRKSEVEIINGAIPRVATTLGLQAPVNDMLTRLLAAAEGRVENEKSGGTHPIHQGLNSVKT